jgi:hypothetical protein
MRNTKTIIHTLFVFLLVIEVAGCASLAKGRADPGGVAFVSVENHNFLDLDVFAIQRGAPRRRLGMVTGASTVTFTLPREFVAAGTVRIVAVPIGGFGSAGSGQVSVSRGETIVFSVEQNLALSSVIIR